MLTLASNTQSILSQTTGTTFEVASDIEEATGGETIANNPCAAADELVVAQGQKIDSSSAVEHGSSRAQSDDLADPTGERGTQVLHELSLDDCSRETTAEAGPGQSLVSDAQEQLCGSAQHAREEIVNENNLILVPQTIPKVPLMASPWNCGLRAIFLELEQRQNTKLNYHKHSMCQDWEIRKS